MQHDSFATKVVRLSGAAALIVSLGAAPSAFAHPPPKDDCPGKQVLVRVEEKGCPATPKRPQHNRKRVCCQNPAGKVHCNPFQPCPPNSPN